MVDNGGVAGDCKPCQRHMHHGNEIMGGTIPGMVDVAGCIDAARACRLVCRDFDTPQPRLTYRRFNNIFIGSSSRLHSE